MPIHARTCPVARIDLMVSMLIVFAIVACTFVVPPSEAPNRIRALKTRFHWVNASVSKSNAVYRHNTSNASTMSRNRSNPKTWTSSRQINDKISCDDCISFHFVFILLSETSNHCWSLPISLPKCIGERWSWLIDVIPIPHGVLCCLVSSVFLSPLVMC